MQDSAAQPAALSLAVVNRALRVLAGVTVEGVWVTPGRLTMSATLFVLAASSAIECGMASQPR